MERDDPMFDPNLPDQIDPEVATKMLSAKDTIKTLVIITWKAKGKRTKIPKPIDFQMEFPSTSAARSWITSVTPDPKAVGSLRQILARRTRALLQQNIQTLIEWEPEFKLSNPILDKEEAQDEQPIFEPEPDGDAIDTFHSDDDDTGDGSGVPTPDRPPVPDGPSEFGGTGFGLLGLSLPKSALELPEIGGEAEDGGEES